MEFLITTEGRDPLTTRQESGEKGDIMELKTLQGSAYYRKNGYEAVKNVIPARLIDPFLERFKEEIIPSRYKFFRQSTDRYQISTVDEYGYVNESFLDIHDYGQFPEFSELARQIFFSDELLGTLRKVLGHERFNLMQSMLFDKNTETGAHQDAWYLDTVPSGDLHGVWIALEDIHPDAGRFWVLPESQNVDFLEGDMNTTHHQWNERIERYVAANKNKVVTPEMNKGDIIIWNSKTVHGSHKTVDHKRSRKSLTAHFIPEGYKFGNFFKTKDYIEYKDYRSMKYYKNQPDYSLMNDVKAKIKFFVYNSPKTLRLLRKFQNRFTQ